MFLPAVALEEKFPGKLSRFLHLQISRCSQIDSHEPTKHKIVVCFEECRLLVTPKLIVSSDESG